jgi:hypothetical protein
MRRLDGARRGRFARPLHEERQFINENRAPREEDKKLLTLAALGF